MSRDEYFDKLSAANRSFVLRRNRYLENCGACGVRPRPSTLNRMLDKLKADLILLHTEYHSFNEDTL